MLHAPKTKNSFAKVLFVTIEKLYFIKIKKHFKIYFALGKCHLYFAASNLKVTITVNPSITAISALYLFNTENTTAPIIHGQA